MQLIPPILLINLERSTERLAACQRQLADHNLIRIDAVDGTAIDDSINAQHYDKQKNARLFYRTLSAGEIGCYLSHRKAWQTIVDANMPSAIVLEDDFELVGSISSLAKALGQITHHWDYIKLTEHPIKRRAIHRWAINEYDLITYNKVPARTCAQVVSLSGAKKLLNATERFFRPIDLDLQYWWEKDIEVFGLKPYPFKPNAKLGSDIDVTGNRRRQPTRRLAKLWQQLLFLKESRKQNASRLHALKRQS